MTAIADRIPANMRHDGGGVVWWDTDHPHGPYEAGTLGVHVDQLEAALHTNDILKLIGPQTRTVANEIFGVLLACAYCTREGLILDRSGLA